MAPEEVMTALVNAMQGDIRELKDSIRDMRKENSENIRRLHQRFDDLAQKDPVSRKECEQCRRDCKKGGLKLGAFCRAATQSWGSCKSPYITVR